MKAKSILVEFWFVLILILLEKIIYVMQLDNRKFKHLPLFVILKK